ncbi:hypothetical protein [Planomicrobium sp. Y74]|uniref:hypothetical protein n=1 Tax=Planomicrobium sp. Y74 TaxID=2478977 RepID=UPI000EF553BB|nr:hypothetical protein [Planomicrobium sp. Y74]RLQ91387.1 hypothetical protein D9754_06570 [Planomicrobium sp. Y74]
MRLPSFWCVWRFIVDFLGFIVDFLGFIVDFWRFIVGFLPFIVDFIPLIVDSKFISDFHEFISDFPQFISDFFVFINDFSRLSAIPPIRYKTDDSHIEKTPAAPLDFIPNTGQNCLPLPRKVRC